MHQSKKTICLSIKTSAATNVSEETYINPKRPMSIQRDAYQSEETYINDTRVKHKTYRGDLHATPSDLHTRPIDLHVRPRDRHVRPSGNLDACVRVVCGVREERPVSLPQEPCVIALKPFWNPVGVEPGNQEGPGC